MSSKSSSTVPMSRLSGRDKLLTRLWNTPEVCKIWEIDDFEERVFRLNQHLDSLEEEHAIDGKFYKSDVVEIHPLLRQTFDNDCCTKGYASKCSSCGTLYNIPEYGTGEGHKRTCPICSAQEAKSRASDARELIYGFEWKHLGCLDLTTHPSFLDSDRLDDEAYIVQRQKDLMGHARSFMRKQFPDSPFVMSFHHWHSSNPLRGWHFHIHLVFLCSRYMTQVDKDPVTRRVIPETKTYRVEHFKQHLTRDKLNAMRKCWSDLVEYEDSILYYQWIRRTEFRPKNPKHDHEFQRVRHRLRYMFRGYIQDVNSWLHAIDEIGDPHPTSEELTERVNCHLRHDSEEYQISRSDAHLKTPQVMLSDNGLKNPKVVNRKMTEWKRRTVYCGALSPSQVNKWVKHGTKKAPEEILYRIKAIAEECRVIYCSECHEELDSRQWETENAFQSCDYDSKLAPLRSFIPKKPPDPCLRKWVS